MKKGYTAALLIWTAVTIITLTACTMNSSPSSSPTNAGAPESTPTAAPTELSTAEPVSGAGSEIALSYLDSVGISAEELKADLMNHPELIPFGGVLGGTPAFLPEETAILSESWVYARAEDGHVACSVLYRYDIGADRSITWELVGYDLGDGFETEPGA